MNEKQQELLNFIYQHNLNAQETARYIGGLDVSQEDKQAVLNDYQARQQKQFELEEEQRKQEELARQTQLQADIDQGLLDMREARDKFEAASNELDNTGMFDFLAAETAFISPGFAFMTALSPQRRFEAAKAAQAKAATDLQQSFYEAGREDLADMLQLPKSKFSRRAYSMVNSGSKAALYNTADFFSNNAYIEEQSKFYRDQITGINMETEKTAGELVSDLGDAIMSLDPEKAAGLFVDVGEEAGMMLSDQAPYLVSTLIPYIGKPLNFMMRTAQAYQDVEDNPNYTETQKRTHSFLAGGIESIGDNIIGYTGNWFAGKAVSVIGSKLMSNALLRGATKVGGVTFGEGTSESLQELAIMGSEKYVLGEDFTSKDVVNRMYEGFVGGVLVGGPLSGGSSVVSRIAQPSPNQIASRPGDPSHPLALEISERIDSIIEQAENVEPNSPEAKALESELESALEQERQRVSRSRDYYRKMRRRDRESYDRILDLDDLIGRAMLRSKGLKTDWAKGTAKKELDALLDERNKIYQGFDEKSKAPLSTLEQFEDAVEDIDVAISEVDSDLEAIEGLEPENDNDLKLIHDLTTRKSALKNKKKALQKSLGELQAAEQSGNIDAVAEAYRKLQITIDQRIPRNESTVEQTNDDVQQDQSEAGVQEEVEPTTQEEAQPEVQEEAVVQEEPQPTQEQETGPQPLTFTADDNITDGEIAKLPTQLIRPIRNLLKGLKLPVTVKVHENVEALRKAHPNKSQTSKAFYNRRTREVNIHKGSTVADLRHEFVHAMMHDLLGDAKYRGRIVSEIEAIWGKDNVQKVRDRYADYNKRNQDEEVLAAFMEQYATQDGLNQLRRRGVLQRLKDFFNDLFNKKFGRFADQYTINTDSDLLAVMEAFVAGSEVGSSIQVQSQTEADAQTSAMDSRSRAYPDLQDKVISFKVRMPNRWGEFRGTPQDRTIRVKDYWHWRNYWALQTGNGKHDWIFDAVYIGDNGMIKKIANPNPKRGRDGEVIDMEPKLFSFTQREVRSQLAYQKASLPISSDLNSLRMTRARLAENNAELSQAEIERMSELNQGLRELNELLAKKNPDVDKYEAIRQRLMGDEPAPRETVASTQQPAVDPGIPRSTQFLMGLRPDPNAKFDDSVSENEVLDARIDDSDGVELTHPEGVPVKDLSEHGGRRMTYFQYDRTQDGSGIGQEVSENATSSHASRQFSRDMKQSILRDARAYAKENPDLEDITVLVGFGLQGDSTLSNPKAIDAITSRFMEMSETDRGAVVGEVANAMRAIVNADLNKKDFSIETKALIDTVVSVYGDTDPTDLKRLGIPYFEISKDGVKYAFPNFDFMSDQQFVDFMNGMKKEGEGKSDDTSIRRNSELIGKLLSDKFQVGKELGLTASQLKQKLTDEGLKDIPTADLVSYREVYFEVRKNANGEPELASGLTIEHIPGRPFPFEIVSDKGSAYYGLPRSVPFVRLAAKSKIDSKKATVEEVDRQIAELESGEKQVDAVIRRSGKRDLVMQPDEVRNEIRLAEERIAKMQEEGASVTEISKARAEVNKMEDALVKQRKAQKDEISKLKGTISGKAQSAPSIVIDPTDRASIDSDENLDSREAAEAVVNNSWGPRDRSALQQKFDWVRVKFQDKFAPIMMMQEDIEAARGTRVEEDQNFKRSEELMYGKAHNDLEKLEGKVDRLKKAMVDGGINSNLLNDFLYARHAAERNAMLKERDKVDNGSGMTDKEAADVLASFSEEQRAALEKAAAIADEISQDTRDAMREFGLEADRRIDSFENMFKHYVPLGGFAQDSKDADSYPYPTGGIGFNVKGSTIKKAKGRKTPPANILAQIIQQNAATKIKARRNEALQSLFNLVTANPNTQLWNTSDNIPVNDPDRAVGVRINGEQKFIIFKDASLAKNLKGMGVQKLDALSKVMAKPANFLRAAFTTRNPEFIISNFSRDIMSAIPNAIAEADLPDGAIKDKRAVARKIITRTPQTLKALLKGDVLGKDLDPIIAKYLSEFKEDGGQTGWGFVKPLEQIAAELDAETNEGNKAKKAIKWMEKNSLAHIEAVNDAFENSIRLSSYIEAREAGASRADAAQLAKNITVNFNKSGEYGAVANAYYLFFNASIQGSARIMRSLAKMKQVENPDGSISKQLSGPQRIVIGLGLASGMLAMLNMALSDEDEDGELFYNKIPDYEKERNLIMMYDGKNYIKIPLPYGYNLFSNFGTALAETMAGQRDTEDAMWFVANSAFSSFSPVSFGQSENFAKYLAKGVAPTTLKPLVEIAVNETYFGSKVHQTQFPVGAKRPESELAFRSPAFIKSFFQWMNSATGGSEMVSGSVDVNPDLFWYPFEYYIGGLGQFSMRTAKGAYSIEEMIRTGEKPQLDANDIPFLRKVYGEPSKYYDFDLYDSNKEQVLQLYKERKEADNKSLDRYNGIVKLDKKIKSVEKKLKALRKERRAAQDLPYIQRLNKSGELQEKERILIMEYNALHERLRD